MGSTARHLVLFVHGLGGAPVGTWGSFERLLRADGDLGDLDVGHFSFPTFIFRLPFGPKYPGVPTLAQALATQIENRHVDADDITLVCHSLGGLIGKQYLIDCLSARRAVRVKRAVFYAVPNNGASLAGVASFISWRHPQLRQLCHESDVVRAIGIGWERENVEGIVDVRYVVAALDRVVDEESARKSWGNDRVDVVVDRGHVDVVKPLDASDLSYLILKNHIARSRSAAARQLAATRDPAAAAASGSPACGSDEIRVACSAILRIERQGRYLLVQNIHRPESVAPFGGVYKYFEQARDRLDALSFRPQAIDDDMRNDVRGFVPRESFEAFRTWFSSGKDRESPADCLARELREEVLEVGLDAALVPPQLNFRHVRSVPEGPEHVPTIGCEQYRIFDVYEIVEDSAEAKAFVDALVAHAARSTRLVWADVDSIRRGRAPSGWVIGAHAPYLFGTRRFRDGDPPFATSPPEAAAHSAPEAARPRL